VVRLYRRLLAPTNVIGVLARRGPPEAGALALPTTDQRTQQVAMRRIVAGGKLPVLRHFRLYRGKLLGGDNRWHLTNGDPFARLRRGVMRRAAADRSQGGVPLLGGPGPRAPGVEGAGIDRIGEHIPQAGGIPAPMAVRRTDLVGHEVLGQPAEAVAFCYIVGEYLAYDHGGHRIQAHAGRVARAAGIDRIAKGRASPGQQAPGLQFGLTPPLHALGDQGALVLGHRAADLQDQLVVGIGAHGPIQKCH
jgi:hypothetical protein